MEKLKRATLFVTLLLLEAPLIDERCSYMELIKFTTLQKSKSLTLTKTK
jgi:hypothetical protein